MDVAADKTNEFYKGLQPYIDQSTGAVSLLKFPSKACSFSRLE